MTPRRPCPAVGTDAAACAAEVADHHEVIEQWLTGASLNPEECFAGFAAAHAPGFVMIDPDGRELARPDVLAGVERAYGSAAGLRIEIDDVRVVAADLRVVVATYRERHVPGDPVGVRRATVVFIRDRGARHGLSWLHLHETWEPQVR